MDAINKQKNKNSYRRLNDWLNMLLCWTCWTPIPNQFDIHTNDNFEKLVDEYRLLITVAEPSTAQQLRIEQILELAISNTALSTLIDRVEQDIAREIGIFEENISISHNSNVQPIASQLESDRNFQGFPDNIVKFPSRSVDCSIQKTYSYKRHFSIPSTILGGAIVMLGVYIFHQCSFLNTNHSKETNLEVSSNLKSKSPLISTSVQYYLPLATFDAIQKGNAHNKKYIISLQEVGQAKNLQIGKEKETCFVAQRIEPRQRDDITETRQLKMQLDLETLPNLYKIADNLSEVKNVSLIITACP